MQKIKSKNGTVFREKIYVDGRAFFSPRFKRKADAVSWKARFQNEKSIYLSTGQKSPALLKELLSEEEVFQPSMQTFSTYANNWMDTKVKSQLNKRTHERYLSNLNVHILPLFGNLKLNEIQRSHVTTLIDELFKKGHSPKGINLIADLFKRVMLEAYREEIIFKNPFMHIKKLKEQKRMDTYLTQEEIFKLLDVSKGHYFHTLFILAINTGMRRGELAGLTWRKIFFEQNLIEIAQTRDRYGINTATKTIASKRYVPINAMLKKYLLEIKPANAEPDDCIILDDQQSPYDVNHSGRFLNRFLKKAQIKTHFRFHDIRHSYASHFMMNGGNIYDLQKILGHTSLEMTQRYAHLAPEHLIKASNIVSFGSSNTSREKTLQLLKN